MRLIPRFAQSPWLAVGLLLVLTAPSREQAPDAGVTLQVVKYDALGKTIRQFKGKVLVVDFWGTT